MNPFIVVMGISGCGKTTIAEGLAEIHDFRSAQKSVRYPRGAGFSDQSSLEVAGVVGSLRHG